MYLKASFSTFLTLSFWKVLALRHLLCSKCHAGDEHSRGEQTCLKHEPDDSNHAWRNIGHMGLFSFLYTFFFIWLDRVARTNIIDHVCVCVKCAHLIYSISWNNVKENTSYWYQRSLAMIMGLTHSCVENYCCCPRTVNISNANFNLKIHKGDNGQWKTFH